MLYLWVSWVDLIYLGDNEETIRFRWSTSKGKIKERSNQNEKN